LSDEDFESPEQPTVSRQPFSKELSSESKIIVNVIVSGESSSKRSLDNEQEPELL